MILYILVMFSASVVGFYASVLAYNEQKYFKTAFYFAAAMFALSVMVVEIIGSRLLQSM